MDSCSFLLYIYFKLANCPTFAFLIPLYLGNSREFFFGLKIQFPKKTMQYLYDHLSLVIITFREERNICSGEEKCVWHSAAVKRIYATTTLQREEQVFLAILNHAPLFHTLATRNKLWAVTRFFWTDNKSSLGKGDKTKTHLRTCGRRGILLKGGFCYRSCCCIDGRRFACHGKS